MPSKRETQKLEKEQAELDQEMRLLDQYDPHRDHDATIVSSWRHMENVYASNELLRLLKKHHGD
jgi:hypothetical protein